MSRKPASLKLFAAYSRVFLECADRDRDRAGEFQMPFRPLDIALGHIGDDRRHQRIAECARRSLPRARAPAHCACRAPSAGRSARSRRSARGSSSCPPRSRRAARARSALRDRRSAAARPCAAAPPISSPQNSTEPRIPSPSAATPRCRQNCAPVAYPDPGSQATIVAISAPRITTSQGGAPTARAAGRPRSRSRNPPAPGWRWSRPGGRAPPAAPRRPRR